MMKDDRIGRAAWIERTLQAIFRICFRALKKSELASCGENLVARIATRHYRSDYRPGGRFIPAMKVLHYRSDAGARASARVKKSGITSRFQKLTATMQSRPDFLTRK